MCLNLIYLRQYLTDFDENFMDFLQDPFNLPGTDVKWELFTSVPSDDLQTAVQDCEYGFRFKVENRVSKGRVQYYYCRRIKVKASQQCGRRMMVFIPNGSERNCSINLKGAHTCDTAKSEDLAKTVLTKENYAEMDRMLRSGIPLKDIKKHIRASNPQVSKNRVNYAIMQASQAMYGCGELSLGKSLIERIFIWSSLSFFSSELRRNPSRKWEQSHKKLITNFTFDTK